MALTQDPTLAPSNQAEPAQEPPTLSWYGQKFSDEQRQHKLDGLNEGMIAEFGRKLTSDEMRKRATPDMVRGWLESGEKKYVSVLEERLSVPNPDTVQISAVFGSVTSFAPSQLGFGSQ